MPPGTKALHGYVPEEVTDTGDLFDHAYTHTREHD
jgi:hypothetical protein